MLEAQLIASISIVYHDYGGKDLDPIRSYQGHFAHGYLYGFDPTTGVYRFKSLDTDEAKTMHIEDTFDFTLNGIGQSTLRVQELFTATLKINDALLG